MKRLVYLFILYCNCLHAQHVFVKEWDYRYGGTDTEGMGALMQTSDGGYIFGGSSYSGLDGDKSQDNRGVPGLSLDYWIVKTDSLGIKKWDKRFGGDNFDYFRDINSTSDGGYILGGFSNTDKNGDRSQSSQGGYDYWIIKIDSLGNKQWDKRFGGTSDDNLLEVKQTADGGFILGGFSSSDIGGDRTEPSWGHQDYWIVKIDSLAHKQWDKRFGGGASDLFSSIVQTNDGGYLLGGHSSHGLGGDHSQPSHGNSDYWIVKIDANGNKLWDKDYGGWEHDYLHTITIINDGNYLLGGVSYSNVTGNKSDSSKGNADYWLVKIDTLGNIIWDKAYGGTFREELVANVTQTTNNGFLVSGLSRSNAGGNKSANNLGSCQTWIVKTDFSGNLQWEKTLLVNGDNCISSGGFAIQSSERCFVSANSVDGGIGGDKTQPNWDVTDSTYDQWIVKFCDTSVFTSTNQFLSIQNSLSIYPNPFVSSLSVSLNDYNFKHVGITIRNILGEKMFYDHSNNASKIFKKDFDLGYLSKGFYLIEVEVDGARTMKKVLKQ
jgi:hypothetical protein